MTILMPYVLPTRGFRIVAVRPGAVDEARKIEPNSGPRRVWHSHPRRDRARAVDIA